MAPAERRRHWIAAASTGHDRWVDWEVLGCYGEVNCWFVGDLAVVKEEGRHGFVVW